MSLVHGHEREDGPSGTSIAFSQTAFDRLNSVIRDLDRETRTELADALFGVIITSTLETGIPTVFFKLKTTYGSYFDRFGTRYAFTEFDEDQDLQESDLTGQPPSMPSSNSGEGPSNSASGKHPENKLSDGQLTGSANTVRPSQQRLISSEPIERNGSSHKSSTSMPDEGRSNNVRSDHARSDAGKSHPDASSSDKPKRKTVTRMLISTCHTGIGAEEMSKRPPLDADDHPVLTMSLNLARDLEVLAEKHEWPAYEATWEINAGDEQHRCEVSSGPDV